MISGKKIVGARNVIDVYVYPENSLENELIKIIKRLGKGAFIYTQCSENVIKLTKLLNDNSIKAEAYLKASKKLLEAFDKGELDVLIGTATLRSSLVRGIDLPEKLRYVVFYGIPKYTIEVSIEKFTPSKMLIALGAILRYLDEKSKIECGRIMEKLRKIVNIPKEELERIKESEPDSDFLKYAKNTMLESINFFNEIIIKPEIREKANIIENKLIYPDSLTYIQASGRTSRLTIKGLTKGLSIILIDDEKSFKLLKEQLEALETSLFSINEVNLEEILKEIDETRLKKRGLEIEFESILLIVESPTKAKNDFSLFRKSC